MMTMAVQQSPITQGFHTLTQGGVETYDRSHKGSDTPDLQKIEASEGFSGRYSGYSAKLMFALRDVRRRVIKLNQHQFKLPASTEIQQMSGDAILNVYVDSDKDNKQIVRFKLRGDGKRLEATFRVDLAQETRQKHRLLLSDYSNDELSDEHKSQPHLLGAGKGELDETELNKVEAAANEVHDANYYRTHYVAGERSYDNYGQRHQHRKRDELRARDQFADAKHNKSSIASISLTSVEPSRLSTLDVSELLALAESSASNQQFLNGLSQSQMDAINLRESGTLMLGRDASGEVRGLSPLTLAAQTETSVSLLTHFFQSEDPAVRLVLARNPSTPPALLESMAETVIEHLDFGYVTARDAGDLAFLNALQKNLFYNSSLSNTSREAIKGKSFVLPYVTSDAHVELAKFISLKERIEGAQTYRGVGSKLTTPPDELRKLAGHENVFVRAIVAMNPNTPSDVLKQLAQDRALIPNTPSGCIAISQLVGANPNAPADTLAELADRYPLEVAYNRGASRETLEKIGTDYQLVPSSQLSVEMHAALASNLEARLGKV